MAINKNDPPLKETSQDLVVVEDEFLQAGFTQVPNAVLRMPDISHGAKLTYAVLLSYAWQKESCFTGQEQLAKDLCVKRWSVNQYLNELKAKGLVRVERRGLGKTNVYYLPRLPEADGKPGTHPDVWKNTHQEVGATTHKEYSSKNTQKEEYEVSRVSRRAALNNSNEDGIGDNDPYSRERDTPKEEKGTERRGVVPEEYHPSTEKGQGVVRQPHPQETDLHHRDISRSTALKNTDEPPRPPTAALTPITTLLAERQALLTQRKNNRFSKGPPPPELEAAIRDVSAKLADTHHMRENISQAANLYRAWGGVHGSSFAGFVYEACAITRQQDQVKKQMPYFFQVLKDLLGLTGAEQGSITPG